MKTVMFLADAVGQALNCVAIGQALVRHRIRSVFVADRSFSGTFSRYGFEEHLIDTHGLIGEAQASEAWAAHVKRGLASFGLSTIEQLEAYVAPYVEGIVDSSIRAEPLLRAALSDLKPDLICVDDVVAYPAVIRSEVPWCRIVSCNEGEIADPLIPPQLSGYRIGEPAGWDSFRGRYLECTAHAHRRLNDFLGEHGIGPYPEGQYLEESPHANFIIYPEPVKYARSRILSPDRFHYLNGCIRREKPYLLPAFKTGEGHPLIYLGYGSMGAADTDLIRAQIEAFADQPFRVLVSIGPHRAALGMLPDNVVAEEFVPQPALMPQCDLVIHHGGNNTFNEVLFFGKPQIVLPFAWDGHDNAARVSDLGLGVALHRYESNPRELPRVASALLGDESLRKRLLSVSRHMQAHPGPERAAAVIIELIKRDSAKNKG